MKNIALADAHIDMANYGKHDPGSDYCRESDFSIPDVNTIPRSPSEWI
jgi:hypothetical protein